ncbi:MAG: hypothetical protein WC149_12580 [Arcobacteraceae bacterium]
MNFYYFIDLFVIANIIFLSYLAYKNRFYIQLFEYFKIFILITIAAKLASIMAIFLQKIHFLNADSYAVAIFIAFAINLTLLFSSYQLLLKMVNHFINSQKIKEIFAKIITVFEITVIVTFCLFILMQISFIKKYASEPFAKTVTYPYIKSFYIKFLNDDFIYAILHSDTKTNHKEVLFKSFTNSL